jgi:caa(3)-type oxidase subunit IV
MSEHPAESGKKVYLQYAKILGVLAVLTVTMIFIGESALSQAPKVILLLLGSCTKATLIIFYFMHLRFEHKGLVLTVVVGIFVTSILMFLVPAYDGGYILEHSLFK